MKRMRGGLGVRKSMIAVGAVTIICCCLAFVLLPSDNRDGRQPIGTSTKWLGEARSSEGRHTPEPGSTITSIAGKVISPTLTLTPVPTLTPKRKLEAGLRSVLGSTHDANKPSLIDLSIGENGDIVIEWLIQSRMGSGVESDWAYEDARNILITVGKSEVEYSTIEIIGQGRVVDNEGNEREIEVVRMKFVRASLQDVNWDYFEPWYRPMPLHEWAIFKKAHPQYQWWVDD